MKRQKAKKKTLAGILAGLIICEVLFWVLFWRLGVIPWTYLGTAVWIFLLVDFLLALMMFFRDKYSMHRGTGRQTAAAVLSAALAVLCLGGSYAAYRIGQSITAMMTPPPVKTVVDVYVLADREKTEKEELRNFTFAATDTFDWTSTQKAIGEMEKRLDTDLSVDRYPSVMESVDSLYHEQADAVVVNNSYLGVLEDIEGYSDFREKTKLVEQHVLEAPDEPREAKKGAPVIPEEPFILYISGMDTWNGITTKTRSDVNILAAVNPQTKQVLLVNTPRDYYVKNPAGKGALDKLTHCGIYGVECSMKALENLYGIKIYHYGKINFTGFETLINAIGGVDLVLDEAVDLPYLQLKQGLNHLDGKTALTYARERHHFAGGDNARGKHQMEVISSVISKMSGSTMLTNYNDILDSLQGMFTTNVTQKEMSELIKMQLQDMSSWNVNTYAVTGSNGSERTFSAPGHKAYVMYPHHETVKKAKDLITRVMEGEVLTPADVRSK